MDGDFLEKGMEERKMQSTVTASVGSGMQVPESWLFVDIIDRLCSTKLYDR